MRRFAALCLAALCATHGAAAAQAPADEGARTQVKVAVVVSGDPDPVLVAAAAAVNETLGASPGLLLPADPALVDALGGAPAPAADDGLAEARALRRRLGISPAGDVEILARLGRLAGAVAVVVVARAPEPRLEVFDVGRTAHFADTLPIAGAEPAAIRRFVGRRARAAHAHAGEARPEPRTPAPPAEAAATVPGRGERGAEPTERRRLLRRGVAYGAAGAVLVGLGVFLIVDRVKDDPAPIIRIRPGGG